MFKYRDNQKATLWTSYSSNPLELEKASSFTRKTQEQTKKKKKKSYEGRLTARMESTGGEVKTSPPIAAVSIPSPTNPACAGSCPLPPPVSKIGIA